MNTVHVGKDHAIRTPQAIPAGAMDTKYIIDPGLYGISPARVAWKNVELCGSTPEKVTLHCGMDTPSNMFDAGAKDGSFTLRSLIFDIRPKSYVVKISGCSCDLHDISHLNGGLFIGDGANAVNITRWRAFGEAAEYRFANFGHPIKMLRVDNSEIPDFWIAQSKNEADAAIREMQIDNAEWIHVNVRGSNYKQAWQVRPGGMPGNVFHQSIHRKCKITGGIDFGNFKDPTDANFPFGVLLNVLMDSCDIDKYSTTKGGSSGIGEAWGIGNLGFKNTLIGGHLTNKVIQ